MEVTRPTIMEIDLDAFRYNINQIKNKVGKDTKIMPVIKANGYGTYINKNLKVINEFDIVAVATVDEGVFLRNLGYQKEIFVLNQAYKSEIGKIINYNLTIGISSLDFLEELSKRSDRTFNVHIEIGTGMGRTGINPYKVENYINHLTSNIKVEGIYTHLSSADIDDEYTKKQLESFNIAVKKAKEMLGDIKYIHSGASNAILNYPNSYFNLVRPGIIIYGYPSSDDTYEKMSLKPIAKLKSKITFLKEVEKGTSIGYSRSYITKDKAKIATVPIGYADGLRRGLSNNGEVIINGKKVNIIGKICMDSFMVDVTDLPDVKLGDDVYIWDNENITLEDIANHADTINYEILSCISDRVPRVFINE